MDNIKLIDSIQSKKLSSDTKKIIESGWSLLGKSLDIVTSIPIYDFVTSFSDGVVAIREYRTLKMIAHFFESFESLNWNERTEFSYRLQNNVEYEDFTEKILFYLESLQDKQKAIWIGRMAVALAKTKISMLQFDISYYVIKNAMPGDLTLLKKVFKQAVHERKNDLIQDNNLVWLERHVFKYIGLHYYNESNEVQTLSTRTINSFLSIGLLERELKEIKTSARNMGLDGEGGLFQGYREIYSFSEIALLIFIFALRDEE